MKLAILSRNSKLYSTRRLVEAARERGHSVRVLDPLRCYMRISTEGFEMHYKGAQIAGYHAVVPRVGASVTVTDPIDGARAGRIVQIYPAITGGQVMADASLPGLSARFISRRIGVTIETGRRDAIVVPRRYVSTRFGIDYVDVVSRGILSAVPVQTTPVPGGDTLQILSGIGAGDTLFAAAR